jgi:CHAT domain-containing protein/tetratricopeptide (TPR) repeat protein
MMGRKAGQAMAAGVAAWLAAAPAEAAQPAPSPPQVAPAAETEEELDPRATEFLRLVDAFNAAQEADDFDGAAKLAEPLVRLGGELLGSTDTNYLAMLKRVGSYLAATERRAEALPIFQRLHDGTEAALGADHPEAVEALNLLGAAHLSRGQFLLAEPAIVRAVERAERLFGPDDERTVTALTNLGVLRIELGRYEEAVQVMERVLTASERVRGPEHQDTLDALNALGAAYRGQGRLEEALPMLERVLAVRERVLGASDPQTIYSMNAMAAVQLMLGERAAAEALYRRALVGATPLGDQHPVTMDALDGVAGALLMQAKHGDAVPLAERAMAARERMLGVNHPATLRSLSVLANVYIFSGQTAKAEPLLVRAMEESARLRGEAHPDTLQAAENLVYARLSANLADPRALEPAIRLVRGAWQRSVRGSTGPGAADDPRGGKRARWYWLFADAALAAGDADPARKPALLADVFVALQEAVSGEASAAIARMAVRRNVEQQGQGLGPLVREREQLLGRLKALNEQIAQSFGATGGEAERTQMRGERDTATRRIEAIDARIAKEFPDYHLLVRPQPIQGPEAQALLKEDEAVLIAVPGRFGTHLLAMSRERAEWVRTDWTDENVIYAVNRLRFDVGAQVTATPEQAQEWEKERPAGDRLSFDRTTAHNLYTAVFAPVEGVLKNKKRVYVIAGEALAALPFSMLVTAPPTGADDDPAALRATSWLAERYALVQVPSLQALKLLRAAGADSSTGGFVGFGDPAFEGKATRRGARRSGGAVPPVVAAEDVVTQVRTVEGGLLANVAALRALEQLPGTARELKAMGDIFGPAASRIFTRATATEAQVRSADLSRARVLTFATHGLTPADPIGEASASELYELAEPGLVLTPPAQASEADDGFLSASEVATLKLDADWVILSACNTASGDAATAGLSQLARAFFYAGARSLLASHWPVDDEVAAKMTVRTLALEQAGTPRAEAFQQAMREIRTDPAHPEWAHPFYWSPFVLIGDAGK